MKKALIVYENHPSLWRFAPFTRSIAMGCEPQQLELQRLGAISLLHIKGSSTLSFTRSVAVTLLPVGKRAACVDRLESNLFLSPRFSRPKEA